MFEKIRRLLEISVLVVEYEKHIRETAQCVGREEMYSDLRRLEEALEQASYFFKRQIREVQTLHDTL